MPRASANKRAALVLTAHLFDGRKRGRYTEDDAPNPWSAQGRSKRAGERAVLASGAAAIVLRTRGACGHTGGNVLTTMLRLAMQRGRRARSSTSTARQWGLGGRPNASGTSGPPPPPPSAALRERIRNSSRTDSDAAHETVTDALGRALHHATVDLDPD